MNGIDISSHQQGIDLAKVPCDFVIVKATQGTKYVNPDFVRACNQALTTGKLLGVYHYASRGGAEAEARHFLKTVAPYIGKAILVLDWEEEANANFPSETYAKDFLDYVKANTGIVPFLYAGKYNVVTFGWPTIAQAGYPLWAAQYANNQATGYKENPWTDTRGFGAWSGSAIFQYSSKGRLDGWSGNLDLNKAYIDADTWRMYASGKKPKEKEKPKKVDTSKYPLTVYYHRNEYVRLLQNALTARGFHCVADGIFGAETFKMVKAFQRSHVSPFTGAPLEVDGAVGRHTWAALFS